VSDVRLNPADFQLPSDHPLRTYQRYGAYLGIAALIASAVAFSAVPKVFLRGYLIAYMFWLGIALGSMGILLLQYITGGRWGAVLRRVLEAAAGTIPLLAVLFIPLALRLGDLFAWAQPATVAGDPILQQKMFYLNVPFFLARAVFYFAVWLILEFFLSRWGSEPDGSYNPANETRLQFLGRGGLLLYALTMTFASIDWMMSLEPHWFSTIYGIMVLGGQILSGFTFAIVVAATLKKIDPVARVIGADQFHDLGKLMLAFVMLWAYFAFSQYIIIWSGNVANETPWYLARTAGGWQWLAFALIAFHFAVPFLVLLSRPVKRDPRLLAIVAIALLVMRYVDLAWLITPAFSPGRLSAHVLDLVSFTAIGGLWIYVFVHQLSKRPLVPIGEPILPYAEDPA